MDRSKPKFRLGAVSYLNTVPLIYGMTNGPQWELVDVRLSTPSVCAEEVESGATEIGLVPVAEIARQNLQMVPGVGICCRGAVRSILLVSRVPWRQVRTLAADSSSRTSVQLARVILRERYGVEPEVFGAAPDWQVMLAEADAALIIGDPALRVDLVKLKWEWLDLGAEWYQLTRLPMVFAMWAGKPGIPVDELRGVTQSSWEFGMSHLDVIVEQEFARRGITRELADHYVRECIQYQVGAEQQRGLEAFFELAALAPSRT